MNLNHAIFRESYNKKALAKFGSLFPGVGFGAAYKILQRVYKFGGQPVLKDIMTVKYGDAFEDRFGHTNGRIMIAATSGRYDCIAIEFIELFNDIELGSHIRCY